MNIINEIKISLTFKCYLRAYTGTGSTPRWVRNTNLWQFRNDVLYQCYLFISFAASFSFMITSSCSAAMWKTHCMRCFIDSSNIIAFRALFQFAYLWSELISTRVLCKIWQAKRTFLNGSFFSWLSNFDNGEFQQENFIRGIILSINIIMGVSPFNAMMLINVFVT